MIDDRVGSLIGILCGMALVGSALFARRGTWRHSGWKMALSWVAIIALLILAGRWLDGLQGTT